MCRVPIWRIAAVFSEYDDLYQYIYTFGFSFLHSELMLSSKQQILYPK